MDDLHRHIQARDCHLVAQDLASNPNLVTKTDADGRTPLMWALSESQDANLAQTILTVAANCAAFDINHADDMGYTSLHIAAAISAPLTELVLKLKPEVDARTTTNQTPLMLAVSKQNFGVVQLLMESGANPRTRGARQVTPLMRAAALGSDRIVSVLLAHNALPNATDVNGWSAVHYAFSEGRSSTLDLLVAHNGDLELESRDQEKPRDVAPLGFRYVVK